MSDPATNGEVDQDLALPMSDAVDLQAILELRMMARLYGSRGNRVKADELLLLAEQMEVRLKRIMSPDVEDEQEPKEA